MSLCDNASRIDDLGGYCRKRGTLPGVRHRSVRAAALRICSLLASSCSRLIGCKSSRRPSVPSRPHRGSWRSQPQPPRRHTQPECHSAWPPGVGVLAHSLFQEQALRSNGRRTPEQSATRTNLPEPCWNALVCPMLPTAATASAGQQLKRAELSPGAPLNSSGPRSSPIHPSQRRRGIVTAPHRAAPRYKDIKRSRSDSKVFRRSLSRVVFTRLSERAKDAS